MTRQWVRAKKVRKYAKATGLPVVRALVRGGTDHRVDLCLEDGSVVMYWPRDGSIEHDTQWRWCRAGLTVNPGPC